MLPPVKPTLKDSTVLWLQVPSLPQTKRLPAFCLLHIGMQVRLTTTLHQPYAVQDATATVLEIHFADNDAQAHQHMRGAKHVDVLLDLLPVAVLIQLHDCKHVFLPVGPCSRCSSFADIWIAKKSVENSKVFLLWNLVLTRGNT